MAGISRQISNGWQVVNTEDLSKYGLSQLKEDAIYEPIAIVGMSLRAQDTDNVSEFRETLLNKDKHYGEITNDKWSKDEWYRPTENFQPGFTNAHAGGFMDCLYQFDHAFFNTSPKEANNMDPQQYHVCEVAQEALHDAGITAKALPKNTAVYVSMKMGEQTLLWAETPNLLNPYTLTGLAHTCTANRVSYFYDIQGASMGIEASCAAATHGIHMGVWSLWNNECDLVIAAGANCILTPHFQMAMCAHDVLSKSGDCRPFDEGADGRVRSEGSGAIILKKLSDAIRDGDHVHCVIRTSATGYHGKEVNLMTNTSESIEKIVTPLYDRFGINPDNVDYLEANATGLMREDTEELKAMDRIFGNKSEPLKMGSLKSNYGHLENASGMFSAIKLAMMLKNREIYPQANYTSKNKALEGYKFDVPVQHEKYTKEKNMMVALNSTSFSGQVCHMIMEEFKNLPRDMPAENLAGWTFGGTETGILTPIILSAKTKPALKDLARRWLAFENEADANAVGGWLATRIDQYSQQLMILASSSAHFRENIEKYLAGENCEYVVEGTLPNNPGEKPKICLIYPGQGQQWWDMGRVLYATEPLYRAYVDEMDGYWKEISGYSFIEEFGLFMADSSKYDQTRIDEIIVCQPVIVSHAIGLTKLYENWGITSDMICGHSLGEMAAGYMSGCMTLRETTHILYVRASTQNLATGYGKMAAARFGPEQGDEFVAKYDGMYVACYNSTDNVTVAGENEIMTKLEKENPTKLKIIRVQAAFHTPILEVVKDAFFKDMVGTYEHKSNGEGCPTYYSTVAKDVYHGPTDVNYWWNSVAKPVYFVDANKSIFRDHEDNVLFLEITASATLLGSIRQTAKALGRSPKGLVPCGLRNKDDRLAALKGIATLHHMGVPIAWDNVYKGCASYVQIPTYPWQRARFYKEGHIFMHRRTGLEDKSYVGRLGEISVNMHPFLADYKLCGESSFPSSAAIEFMSELIPGRVIMKDVQVNEHPRVDEPDTNVIGDYESVWLTYKTAADKITIRRRQNRSLLSSATFLEESAQEIPEKLDLEAARAECPHHISPAEFYSSLPASCLKYGEMMQALTEIHAGEDKALGYLKPEAALWERTKTVTVDGCFQLAMAAFCPGKAADVTSVEYLEMFVQVLPTGQNMCVVANLLSLSTDSFTADLYVTDVHGGTLMALKGVRFEMIKVDIAQVVDNLYVAEAVKAGEEYQKFDAGVTAAEWDLVIKDPFVHTECEFDHIEYNFNAIDIDTWHERTDTYHIFLPQTEQIKKVKAAEKKRELNFYTPHKRQLKKNGVCVDIKAITNAKGLYQSAGSVVDIGSDVTDYKVGDDVIVIKSNVMSSKLVTSDHNLMQKPAYLSWEQASCFGLVYGTAAFTLLEMAELESTSSVLVYPRDTELSRAFAQIGHAKGARVILANPSSLSEDVRSATGGQGADIVVDTSGGNGVSDDLMACVAEGGVLCVASVDGRIRSGYTTAPGFDTIVMDGVDFMTKAPKKVKKSLAEVESLLGKDINSLNVPVTAFPNVLPRAPVAEVEVMKVPEGFTPEKQLPSKLSLLPDAAYAVICGDNSLYMSVATYLADRGARNLHLVGAKTESARHKQLVAMLHKSGCSVTDISGMSQDGECAGVFYADQKLSGSPHEQKEHQYFVLVSSSAALAAEHDALSLERRKKGLRSLSLHVRGSDSSSDLAALDTLLQMDKTPPAVSVGQIEERPDLKPKPTKCELLKEVADYMLLFTGFPQGYLDHFENIPLREYGIEDYERRCLAKWFSDNYDYNFTTEDVTSGRTITSLVDDIYKLQ